MSVGVHVCVCLCKGNVMYKTCSTHSSNLLCVCRQRRSYGKQLTYSVCCCLRTFIVKMWSTPLFQCRIFLALFRNKKPNKLHWDCFTHYSLFQGYNAPHLLLLCCAFWATFLNPEPSRSLFCSFLADILWRSLTNFRSFLEWSNIFFSYKSSEDSTDTKHILERWS